MSDSAPPPAAPPAAPAPAPQGAFGRFIQAYSSFLSSFVIGAAGLIATTSYQWNQADLARKQAESQLKITETQADNSWRIERAKILSQNLQVLSQQGSGNVEQRYGVLLSLTRGNILDPELAVSYALELGKDNPDYMRSVLQNARDKDYRRLLNAYTLTCEQRYGVSAKRVQVCKSDAMGERSAALAELVSDEQEAALVAKQEGPLVLLKDEREVLSNLGKLVWLFTPYLSDQYEKRQWQALQQVVDYAPGAQLVVALALLVEQNGLLTHAEAPQLDSFREERRRWLTGYLVSDRCDAECRGKVVHIMLGGLERARQSFAEPLKSLLGRPRAEIAVALNRLNQRLLLCQVALGDQVALRDYVLVPLLVGHLKRPKLEGPVLPVLDDLIGLLAPLPAPASTGPTAPGLPTTSPFGGTWAELEVLLQKVEGGKYLRQLTERRQQQRRARDALSPTLRRANFCNVVNEASLEEEGEE